MAKPTDADPAGQRDIRRKAHRAFVRRLRRIRGQVLERFARVQADRRSPRANRETPVWVYVLPPQELQQFTDDVARIVDEELGIRDPRRPPQWWMLDEIERAYRGGVLSALVGLNQAVRIAQRLGFEAREINPESTVASRAYRTELEGVYVRTYQVIQGMGNDMTVGLMRAIQDGTDAGLPPSQIRNQVRERFGIAERRSRRIVDTEVQWAYNKARLDAASLAEFETGLEARVMHISALLPTTRKTHAARHKKIYTPEEQRAWWLGSDGNSQLVNCRCTIRPILADGEGGFIDQPEDKNRADKIPPKRHKTRKQNPSAEQKNFRKKIEAAKPHRSAAPPPDKPASPQIVRQTEITPNEGPPKIQFNGKLSGDESTYLEYYKGDGFFKQNQILRNQGAFSQEEVQAAQSMRDSINAAISRSTITEGGVLYRGIRSRDLFQSAEKLIGKKIPILTPQSTASRANAATSWAGLLGTPTNGFFSSNPGESVVFKIRTKPGQRALNMERLGIGNTGEREVLLRSGGKYHVIGVTELRNPIGEVSGKVIEVELND